MSLPPLPQGVAAALEGLALGDAFGEQFFVEASVAVQAIGDRRIPQPPWRWTDDTNMALSIVEILAEFGEIRQDELARNFARRFDPSRGYGPAMPGVLQAIAEGRPWRTVTEAQFSGQGSFGNGAAMRVAPLGAWFAGDLDRVVEQARLSALVTHAHPEAAAGAVAVAVGTAIAAASSGSPVPPPEEFLASVAGRTPASGVRDGLVAAARLDRETPVARAAAVLGSGNRVSAPDTVPFALWSAAHHLDDLAECLWATVAGLGDRDTTCAIAGGVVAARTGVEHLTETLSAREPLPAWVYGREGSPG
ncbi:MAG: ADP-ribosylglycohydrolase family protein [Actinomycetota bacterium]